MLSFVLIHNGQGVYRSSYKNALRFTRTEITRAYRQAEYERWQQLDFVVGFRVELSGAHPVEDICDELKGDYPKEFLFTGWHPQCLCYAVALMRGEHAAVKDVPNQFKTWAKDNISRIERAKTIPYFVSDNISLIRTAIPAYAAISGKTKSIIAKVEELKRLGQENSSVLYSDITGGIISNIIKLANRNMTNREKVAIMREIIATPGFEQIAKNSENKTAIYKWFTVKNNTPEYLDNFNGAQSLLKNGYSAYMLPNPNQSVSADYILVYGKMVYYAELKTLYGKSEATVYAQLTQAKRQSDRIIVNIVGNITPRNLADGIKSFYLKNPDIAEIKILKSGKPLDINYNQAIKKNFTKTFMDRWAK